MMLFFTGVILYGTLLNLREKTLAKEMKLKNIETLRDIKVVINKSQYTLELYSGDILVKNYKAVFGKTRRRIRHSALDKVTPTGRYYVCSKDSVTEFHRMIVLNYPNLHDLAIQLKDGYLTREEFLEFREELNTNNCIGKRNIKFGTIGIHGIGYFDIVFSNLPFRFNWTNGSVAVNNDDIEELYSVMEHGTEVIIHP